MEQGHFNITSATTTTLVGRNTGRNRLQKISMCNTHTTTAVTVQLFFEDDATDPNKTYLVATSIPAQSTLVIEDFLSWEPTISSLKLTTDAGGLGTSTPLSVIIK